MDVGTDEDVIIELVENPEVVSVCVDVGTDEDVTTVVVFEEIEVSELLLTVVEY